MKLGTTSPIAIPKDKPNRPLQKGKEYFVIQIANAQAIFVGHIWEGAKQLVVTSKVALGGQESRAIHRTRAIRKNEVEQLGLYANIIDLIPATVDRVFIGIEFLVDKENRLSTLAGLINDSSFVTMLSLAPGQAAAAKAIGGVAQKVIDALFDKQERSPILQFTGDFNIATGGLMEGYYAIVGTQDANRPLPSAKELSVCEGELHVAGKPANAWSYILLDVTATPVRTKDLGRGAPWYEKLSHAEARTAEVANNPFASGKDRRATWEEVQKLIREANLLLSMDPLYLASEVRAIIADAYVEARKQIFGTAKMAAPRLSAETRAVLGIRDEAGLERESNEYNRSVTETRHLLAGLGITPESRPSFELPFEVSSKVELPSPTTTLPAPLTPAVTSRALETARTVITASETRTRGPSIDRASTPTIPVVPTRTGSRGGGSRGGGGTGGGGIGGGGFGGGFGRQPQTSPP